MYCRLLIVKKVKKLYSLVDYKFLETCTKYLVINR